MLYVLHGTDAAKVRTKAHALIETLQTKRPDAEVFWTDSENFSEEKLKELTESQGLFSAKYIVILDKVFENKEAKKSITEAEQVKALHAAEHVFILIEEVLDQKEITLFEKVGARVVSYDIPKTNKQTPTLFALGDALGARDKKNLWLLYVKAKERGVSDEEIHGILWWQMKTIALAQGAKTAGEAGLKPFVFSKAKKYAGNFQGEAVPQALSQLLVLFHESRRGKHDLGMALEAWILG